MRQRQQGCVNTKADPFCPCSVSRTSRRECDVNKGHGSNPARPRVSLSYTMQVFISEFSAAKRIGRGERGKCSRRIKTARHARVVMKFKWHAQLVSFRYLGGVS